ncbi:hypothetical protein G9C85_16645 [Halorubellus sp. JP-L1]|uniref:hypothetical protein n=1 Tax=Halorubellus sp. JP-L1 TaxID=2715753 RepID=UPI0014096144|nr:hypothetical protein [Halorubellus sp. JP-L1]NHN43247.1 hypothetical protein [Halorubellus sp. JP-L1]
MLLGYPVSRIVTDAALRWLERERHRRPDGSELADREFAVRNFADREFAVHESAFGGCAP